MEDIILHIILYIIVVYMHEFGHYIVDYIFDLDPEIEYNNFYLPCSVIRNESGSILKDNIISVSGIILGFIPIILYLMYINNSPTIFIILLIFTYVIGCMGDISKVIERI